MSRFVPANVKFATGKPESPPPPPPPRPPRRFKIPRAPLAVGFLGLLLLAGVILFRGPASAKPEKVETNAHLAHDPSEPRRPIQKYQETLADNQYENKDLGVSISVPEGWNTALGARPNTAKEHEGLLVRMEPEAPLDKATQLRPLVSVVRRDAPKGRYPDALAYIRSRLLSVDKEVIEKPKMVKADGHRLGRVVYEMDSGDGRIRIMQLVRLENGEALIASAMAPADQFEAMSGVFEEITQTMKLGR